MYDLLIPHGFTYFIIKIAVLILALFLWLTFNATPVA